MDNNKPPLQFRQVPVQPQPQIINVPFANVAGFAFNLQSLIAMDMSAYAEGAEGRFIVMRLLGDVSHTFQGPRADQAFHWYLTLTGQARVEGA
jgi:hypothetical protein